MTTTDVVVRDTAFTWALIEWRLESYALRGCGLPRTAALRPSRVDSRGQVGWETPAGRLTDYAFRASFPVGPTCGGATAFPSPPIAGSFRRAGGSNERSHRSQFFPAVADS